MDADIENRAMSQGNGAPEGNEYLHNSGVALYNMDKRPRRDPYWTIAYAALAALVFFWAIPAFMHTDPNSGMYTPGFYYNSTSCDIVAYKEANPPVDPSLGPDPTFMHAFKKSISVWLPVTAVLAVLSSALYLLLFRRFAKAMVTLTIVVSVGSGFVFALVCFFVGAIPFGVILLIVTAISATFYWWIRAQLRMCAELLAIAGRGLNENLGLVPAAIGIKLVGLCALVYGAAGFFSAINVGHVEKARGVNMMAAAPESATCYDGMGNPVPCCSFKTETWASALAFFASCFISWTGLLIMEVKLYTVADTIAQWYFSPSLAANTFNSTGGMTPGSVRIALGHCLRSSFGSVAFASAILAILRAIRRSLNRASRNNIICCIINCFAQPLLALMEKFTRFATIATAITGEAFLPAAKAVFDTLKRNFLQTYSVWWVPESVLHFAVGLLSLSWAGVVFFATYAANKDIVNVWGVCFATTAVSFFFMLYTLLFVSGLLMDTVNTIYICYAMDKDQRRITHPEIHAVYSQIPGLAVENPDGGIMYGAPTEQQQPQATVPPPYPGVYAPVQQTYAAYPAVYPAYPQAPAGQTPPPGYGYVQPHYPANNA